MPGPTSIAVCPSGMARIDLPFSVICFATGVSGTWDQVDNYCWNGFRASLCTLTQWRQVVCGGGTPSPGLSWLATPTGTGTFATVQGCIADMVSTAPNTAIRVGPCCLEWMKY